MKRNLRNAVARKNPEDLEDAVCSFELDELRNSELVLELAALLHEEWHHSHEDLARMFQELRDPRVTASLASAARLKFGYLSHNNSMAFARKCTWALADIGTEESRQALVELSESNETELAGYASKRLDRWAEEKYRKGSPDSVS